MAIPSSCTVLVVGGGPAGSYAAACLAREGIDTVLLEADKFPRYHIGESTLPSLRHFFQFIDVYDAINAHGFYHKNGAVFRLAQGQPDAYTDFLQVGGPEGYAWNVLRSEFDDILFRHAAVCGAQIFESTEVKQILFALERENTAAGPPDEDEVAVDAPRPESAIWARIVQDQKQAAQKKRDLGRPSGLEYYKLALKMAPTTQNLLAGAELASDVRSASDWSYTASTYHLPNARICGDAGSFIDPLFSSGVHLAITGGLSAAASVAASIRGDCDEHAAGAWHSKKTVQSYSRFFLAVSSATKQIREKHLPILQDLNEEGFQRAFDLFRPIIQGTADNDTTSKVTQAEISKILEFCSKSFTYVSPEQKEALFKKLTKLGVNGEDSAVSWANGLGDLQHHLTADELKVLSILQSRRLTREDPFEIDSFTLDPIDGLAPSLVRGSLGLVKSEQARIDSRCLFSPEFLDGKRPGIREGSIFHSSDEARFNKESVDTVA
ncbi:hypothetical protein G3M48_007014 [Beauveria asiatica]|uniref:FAD/NAD(P)-binding domain-containing protein n=1 Tax=Beauveria asiatica TaxID=1069075 RepID=A0AAW0S5C5_9HYPO